jgi:hypothetical protein
MSGLKESIGDTIRIGAVAVCCLGIWQSLQYARADHYFDQDTEETIRTAIRLVPDGWPYYMRLAQFDSAHAEELLQTSIQLNPYNAQADVELGLQLESRGDFARAEKQLNEAYRVDHTYMPRWTLANYYLRRDNLPRFWEWARSAAAMPADDIGALFQLCWKASPDPDTITRSISNTNPQFLRQYIAFLLNKSQPVAAANLGSQLIGAGDPVSDLPTLVTVINRLVAEDQPVPAQSLWRTLKERQWVMADSSVPNNAGFSRAPVPVSFDWSLPEYTGLHSWPGPSGLQVELTGNEPENAVIAEQYVVLNTGNYSLNFKYHTNDIPPGTGIRWQILEPVSLKPIAESNDLSSAELKQSEVKFSVASNNALLLLRLSYHRTLGTVRISGNVNVDSLEIQVRSSQ